MFKQSLEKNVNAIKCSNCIQETPSKCLEKKERGVREFLFLHSEIFIEDLLWAWLFASSQATKVSMSE